MQFEVERLKPIMQEVEDYILMQAGFKEGNKAEIVDMDRVRKNAGVI